MIRLLIQRVNSKIAPTYKADHPCRDCGKPLGEKEARKKTIQAMLNVPITWSIGGTFVGTMLLSWVLCHIAAFHFEGDFFVFMMISGIPFGIWGIRKARHVDKLLEAEGLKASVVCKTN